MSFSDIKYCEIENEVLRNRLKEMSAAARTLADAVERYAVPKKGDRYCSRTELLNTTATLRSVLDGGAKKKQVNP